MTDIDKVVREINRYFGFLTERGFQIERAQYFPDLNQGWVVMLRSVDCRIRIESDRNILSLDFLPVSGPEDQRFDVKGLIYLVTNGTRLVIPFKGNAYWGRSKQLRVLAQLTRDYLDRIIPYFGRDFEARRQDLISAQQAYIQAWSSLRSDAAKR